MSVVTKSIDVDVPTRVAYNQWTQFEDFPHFMEGVESIEQLDDVRLRWHVSIGGVDRTFEALIEDQEPDSRIAWRATEGEDHAGKVSFQPLEASRTRVEVEMEYEPERWTEKVADALNVIDRRVEKDLERFKEFVEEQGHETGAWRGEIDDAQVVEDDTGQGTRSSGTQATGTPGAEPRGPMTPPMPEPGTPQTRTPQTGSSSTGTGGIGDDTTGSGRAGETPRR
jgi:carbon monoxide dehydrogenase subunit G